MKLLVGRRQGVTGWLRALFHEIATDVRDKLRAFRADTPAGQVRRAAFATLVLCGMGLLAVLVLPGYDRALVLTGRSEVLSMQLDNSAFGALDFDHAVLRADPDSPTGEAGPVRLDLLRGVEVRFVRLGRGGLRLSFAAGSAPLAAGDCGGGLRAVGTAMAGGTPMPLCEGAVVLVPLAPGDDPLVVALSGNLVVGEEVSQGAGPRPILLEATASLFVRHGGPVFQTACRLEVLEHLCDRFVANSVALAPGNSVRAQHGHAETGPAGLGFLRADPNDIGSGMVFNLAAPAEAFAVTRLEGETFSVKESLFDVVQRSPLMHTLNAILAAVGLIWYFLRLRGSDESSVSSIAALIWLALAATTPAVAQQAMIRADETGQAMLRARGDRCYAITPGHVMGTETSALITAPGRQQGEGDLLRRVPAAPEPVALISLRGISPALCPPFEGAQNIESLLRNRAAAVLRLVRADGSIDRLPLLIAAVEVETLEVQTELGAALEQGMSGGTLLVGDQPVGLLVDVFNEGRSGRVARLDRIFERIAPHLGSVVSIPATQTVPAGTVAYEIVRSNAAPVASVNKASSLHGDGPGPWRAVASGRAELVLKVMTPISGVMFDVSGLLDTPRSIEMLAGRAETGPWQSLSSISLEPGDTVQVRRFPPVRLPYLLLRASPALGQATVALRGLQLLP